MCDRIAESNPPIGWTKSDTLAICGLFGVTTLLLFDAIFLGAHFALGDLVRYFLPIKHAVADVVRSGSFPWWNPYWSAGQPMAANPAYEIFYPPQWLILIRNFDLGFRLHLVLHFYVAILGCYLLLRSMRLGIAASVFGAASFTFGGPFVSTVNVLNFFFSFAWTSWVWLFARRYLAHPNRRDLALTWIAGGIQATIGEPLTLVMTWVIIGTGAVWSLASRKPPDAPITNEAIRSARLLTALLAGTIAVGAVQLLPAVDHARDTVRASGIPYAAASRWSTPPVRVLELVHPGLLGSLRDQTAVYWGGAGYGPSQSPYLLRIYVGVAAITLFLAGLIGRRPGSIPATIFTVACAALAFGDHTPLFRWIYDLGLFKGTRYPEKFWLPCCFLIVIQAARIADDLIRGNDRVRRTALGIAITIMACTAAGALVAGTKQYEATFAQLWSLTATDPLVAIAPRVSQVEWALSAVRTAFLVGIIASTGRMRRSVWFGLCSLLIAADLGVQSDRLLPRLASSFYSTPPRITGTMQEDRDNFRLFSRADYQQAPEELARPLLAGEPTFWILRNGLFPRTPTLWGFSTVLETDFDATTLQSTNHLADAMLSVRDAGTPDWARPFMAMSNVAWATESVDVAAGWTHTPEVFEAVQPVIVVDGPRVPRYYFAHTIVTIKDQQDFITALTHRKWSDHAAFVSMAAFGPARGQVLRVVESPGHATIDVETAGETLLVASVTAHRYWSARIDDRPADLHVVNLAYQGVVVGAGKHRIEMVYRNPVVIFSGALSLLALVLCGGLLVSLKKDSLPRRI